MILKITLSTLIFFILFSFRVPVFYNSIVLSCFITMILFLFYKFDFYRTLNNKGTIAILFIYLFFIFYVTIYSLSSGVMDFTRLDSTISNMASLISVALLANIFKLYNTRTESNSLEQRFNNVSELIYYAFIAQSLIILLAMFIPTFKDIIQLFQSPVDSVRAEKYEGIRGLALSGGQFFPLSALYATAQLIIFRYLLKGKNSTPLDWLMFLFIVLMGLTSGRTSIIGFSFCIIYFLFNLKLKLNYFLEGLKTVFIFLIITLSFYYVVIQFLPNLSNVSDKFINFAFEFIINYQNTGSFSTKSTDILDDMYWSLSIDTILFGDGYYTNNDGFTYMHTDAGYMRNFLYFGIIGTSIVVFSQIIYSRFLYKITSKDFIFSLLIFIMMLSLHYKGDTLLHLVSVQALFFLLLIIPYQDERNVS